MEDDAIGINETVFANYTNQTDVENTVIDEVSIIILLYKLVSICCLKLKILILTGLIRFFFIGKLDIGHFYPILLNKVLRYFSLKLMI